MESAYLNVPFYAPLPQMSFYGAPQTEAGGVGEPWGVPSWILREVAATLASIHQCVRRTCSANSGSSQIVHLCSWPGQERKKGLSDANVPGRSSGVWRSCCVTSQARPPYLHAADLGIVPRCARPPVCSGSSTMATGFGAYMHNGCQRTTQNLCSAILLTFDPGSLLPVSSKHGGEAAQPCELFVFCKYGGQGRGGEERQLFNPPQRNSPLNPYRELAGKSCSWKAHHTLAAVFLISSAEGNLYSAGNEE